MSDARKIERAARERFLLDLRPGELSPTQVGGLAPTIPPPDAPCVELESWLKAARLWRDMKRGGRLK